MMTELDAIGEPAPAKILKVEDTQVRWEGNPFYKFQLLIEPKGKAPFQATTQGFIALQSLSKYQVGSRVWVKFDPKDRSRVTFIPSTEWNRLEGK